MLGYILLFAIPAAVFQINALVGFFLPLLVAVFEHYKFPRWFRVTIAVGTSALAGLVSTWAEGKLDWTTWGTAVITIFLASQATYATVWNKAAPKIEKATTPGAPA